MKYSNFILFFIYINLITIAALSAQIKYGLKAGLNHTNLVSSTSVDVASKYSFNPIATWHIGMTSNIEVSDKISIQPELLFTQKGGQLPQGSNSLPSNEDNYKYKFSYMSIPILIAYKFGALSIEAGPEIAYLVDDKLLRNGINTHTPFSIVENKFDVSFDLGLKFKFGHFFSQVRWQRSIIPIADFFYTDENGEPFLNVPSYPTAFQLSLGYQLN